MLKLGSDQRRKWLYLCGSHRIYWHLWEFSSVSNQILTLRWIQTKNSKNISWSFPSWHRPPVRLSSSGHFTFFFFLHISLVSFGDRNTFNRASQKKQNKHLQFLHQICPKNKKKNQTFTLSARIWTQRCDSDFAQGCKISLESLGGVHVSLTVWPSPTQRPVDALIINCIAKNNPTTRLSSSGGGWSLLGNMHTQSESLPPPPTASNHTLLLLRSVCKNKKGSKSRRSNWGGAAAEAQNTERRLGRISEVDICSFSPLQVASGERRHHRMSTWTNQVAPFLIKMVKPIS